MLRELHRGDELWIVVAVLLATGELIVCLLVNSERVVLFGHALNLVDDLGEST